MAGYRPQQRYAAQIDLHAPPPPTQRSPLDSRAGDIPLAIVHAVPSTGCKALLRAVHHVRLLLVPYTPKPAKPAGGQRPGRSIQGCRRCPAGAMPMSPSVHLTPREAHWLSSRSRCGAHYLHLEHSVLHLHDEAGRCVHRSRAVHSGAPALVARSRLRPPPPPPRAMLDAVGILRARAKIASRVAVLDVSSAEGAAVMRAVAEWLAPLRRCAACAAGPAGAGNLGDGEASKSPLEPHHGVSAAGAGISVSGLTLVLDWAPSSAADPAGGAPEDRWSPDAAFVFVSAHSWPRNFHGAMAHARELVARCAAVWPPRRVLLTAPSPEAASVIRQALTACIFTIAGLPAPQTPSGALLCWRGCGDESAGLTADSGLTQQCEAAG
jgi:hypothetical protein